MIILINVIFTYDESHILIVTDDQVRFLPTALTDSTDAQSTVLLKFVLFIYLEVLPLMLQ